MTVSAQSRSWLDRAIRYGPAVLLGVAPLVFVRSGGEFENVPKAAFIQTGMALLLLLWLLRGRREEFVRRVPLLDLPVAALFAALLLSLIPAINRHLATPVLLQLLAAAALYLLLSRTVVAPRQAQMIFAAMVASSVVVSAVGIAQQLFALDWIPQAAPPGSTFGNRNMAAHFVAICLPAAIGLVTGGSRRFLRQAAIASLPPAVVFLWMTHTHAAWLALAISLALTPPALFGRMRAAFSRRRMLLVAYLVAILIVAAMLAIPLYSEADAEGTASLRLIFWRNTLAMAADRPLLGVGTGNFELLYPLYHRAAAVDWTFDEEHQLARAHSDHLQMLAETGSVGLLAWLSLFFCGALLVWRSRLWEERRAHWARVSGLMLLTIFVVAAVSFPMQRAIPPLYLFAVLGVLGGLSAGISSTRPLDRVRRLWPRRLLIGLSVLLFVSSVARSRQALLREIVNSEGVGHARRGNHAAAIEAFTRARRLAPFDAEIAMRLAGSQIALGDCAAALEPLYAARRLDPYGVNVWANLGYCHRQLGDEAEALSCLERLVALLPGSPEARAELAGLFYDRGDYERAIDAYLVAVELATTTMSLPGTRSETRVSRPRLGLARAYVASGNYEKAVVQYERLVARGDETPELRRVLEALRLRLQSPRTELAPDPGELTSDRAGPP